MEDWEEKIKQRISAFTKRTLKNMDKLTAEKMIKTNAINPFLVKALGLDLENMTRYYVFQRIQRSVVTSFGSDMEFIVKTAMADSQKGDWWDVVKQTPEINYYVSVKSGPSDMDKDQVTEFSRRAKKIMNEDPKAKPLIGMGYGQSLWPVINSTLKDNQLDPEKYAIFGKKLYELITGDPEHHKKLLEAIRKGEEEITGKDKTILDLIENKIKEITLDFKKKYSNVDELLSDTF